MVYLLDKEEVGFPDPRLGEEDGLLAVGGALTPEWLLTAYGYGIFPWYDFKHSEEVEWWCPMQRFVIFPNEIHISHSLRQQLRKDDYEVTINQAFDKVIRQCSEVDGRNKHVGAWLGKDIISAYTELHRLGFASSVEVWQKDAHGETSLAGGLYGVTIGKNFFGESMFSLIPGGSKIALVALARLMRDSGGLIDCQFETSHLKSMGGRIIDYDEYLTYLQEDK